MPPKRSGIAAGIQIFAPDEIASPSGSVFMNAAPATPSTVPKLTGDRCVRARQVGAALSMQAEPVQEKGKEFLYNIQLHGLQPTLLVRTRILLATWSLLQMPPSDIAKSFEVTGYVPRKRPVKLCHTHVLQRAKTKLS
jgi:hypothetical protein